MVIIGADHRICRNEHCTEPPPSAYPDPESLDLGLKPEEVFVELPPELQVSGEDSIGPLRQSIYGTRSAAKNWQLQLVRDLVGLGFRQARGNPCLFW